MINCEAWSRGSVTVGVPKCHTQSLHTSNRDERGTGHHELIIGRIIGFGCIVGIGIHAGPTISWTADLTQVLIGKLKILDAETDRTHFKVCVDGYVQALQISLIDGEPRRGCSIGISVPKSDA